jgi:xanthine dehydrogenase accessory factor
MVMPVRELLEELTAALDAGRPCVWCAVMETRGSTPQKAGAVMLVYPDGSQKGTLGGGCVEAEVKQRALRVLAESVDRPAVFTFSLDDNYGWDDGLICGGRMTILAHPFPAEGAATYFHALCDKLNAGCGCTEAVVVTPSGDDPPGDRYLFDANGIEIARLASRPAPEVIRKGLAPLTERPGPGLRNGVAFLPVLPRITVFLVGGGHVGQAVADLASRVGFAIRVLDDRDRYANHERFPSAESVMVGEIGATLKDLAPTLTADTYALILTRGHNHDEEALYFLADSACGYVGMIGSKRKIRLIFEDLLAKGLSPEALARVHAPLGLPIGSQTVPEIAVSIVAELIARRNLGTTDVVARARVKPETMQV